MPGQFTRSGRRAQAPSPTGTPGRWERLFAAEDEADFHAHLRTMRAPHPTTTPGRVRPHALYGRLIGRAAYLFGASAPSSRAGS
ncbi:hypothetical protein [Streptomyces sp. cmx-4-9]|uniref:hypothetical protein n=1 Tax=Streptomyces sp. cmx-4-9 TaxID=2790941 RepID=UPI00397F7389